MKQKLIAQGAEAKIFQKNSAILKIRTKKSYRHPILDNKLRKSRTKKEAKILTKALELGIKVPKVLDTGTFNLKMELIEGEKLSETLNSYNLKKQLKIMQEIGEQTAKLHENNIIHGDLTTSNVLLRKNKVFIIDFGLGFISQKIEDKAVDLHLIRQALEAKHFQNYKALFQAFLKGYRKWEESKKIIDRLKIVEKRGRYKH